MDILYRALGVTEPHEEERRTALAQKYRALRANLSGFSFSSDDDLAPALTLIALLECRQQDISLRGLAIMIAQVYGRKIEINDLSTLTSTPMPPGLGLVPPVLPNGIVSPTPPPGTPGPAKVVQFEQERQDRKQTQADEITTRVIELFARHPDKIGDVDPQDVVFLAEQIRSIVLSVLGFPGIH